MQKLLEETILFDDNSFEDNQISYGERWSLIQSQMNKIISKANQKNEQSSPKKTIQAFKPFNVFQQKKLRHKIIINKRNVDKNMSPTNQHKNDENKFDDCVKITESQEGNILENRFQDEQFQQKPIYKSIKKLQLLLVQKDRSITEQANEIYNLSNDRKVSNRKQQDKKWEKHQSHQIQSKKQSFIPQDFGKQDQKLNILTVAGQVNKSQTFSSQVKAQINIKCTQHINIINQDYSPQTQSLRTKSEKYSFQPLGNVLDNRNQQKNDLKRRKSVLRLDQTSQVSRKIIYENNQGYQLVKEQFIEHISDQIMEEQKLKPNQFKMYEDKDKIQWIKSKIKSKIINESDENPSSKKIISLLTKNKSQSLHQKPKQIQNHPQSLNQKGQIPQHFHKFNLALNTKEIAQYKKQISDLKTILSKKKIQKQIMQKVDPQSERLNSQSFIKLPQISSNIGTSNQNDNNVIETSRSQTIRLKQKSKDLASRHRVHSQITQNKHTSLEKAKQKQLNLIFKKEKVTDFHQKQLNPTNETHLDEYKKNNQTNKINKIALSEILNGNVKIDQLFTENHQLRNNSSKSCFFTQYKSPSKKSQFKQGESQNCIKEKRLAQNKQKQSKSSYFSQRRATTNLFVCENIVLKDKADFITKSKLILPKNNKQNIETTNSRTCEQREIQLECKNQDHISEKNLQNTEKENKSLNKEGLKIKKNLDVQRNISLLKISLDRNKNRLVIVRK